MSIWKDAKHHMSLGKCKVKWDTTTHLLERPISGILITPNVGKNVKQEELSLIPGGNAKWYSHFGRQFQISYKSKHTLTIWSNNHTLCYLSKEAGNLCEHKNLHIDIYRNFICNCHTWKQHRCPLVNKWKINCITSRHRKILHY